MPENCGKNPGRAKDPAAVALGKRRQAAMTDEERRAFVRAGGHATAAINRKRTPEERRRIARQAAMTRRRKPKWMAPVVPIRPPAASDDVETLARELADLPDEAIAKIAAALEERFTGS